MADVPIYFDDRQIPAFHPVYHREPEAWYPTNEAASLLVLVGHIWDDIYTLWHIRLERVEEVERRLLFKYIIVELRSIFKPLDRLRTLIITAPEKSIESQRQWRRSVSAIEKRRAKELFKVYNSRKKSIESDILSIRNKLGAHRELAPWQDVMTMWDNLEPDQFMDLLVSIPAIFDFIKELDLYDWARTTERGALQIFGARLGQATVQ